MQTRILNACGCLSCLLVLGCVSKQAPSGSFPQKPIKVIVPFGAGGGSDTFTRILQKAIAEHGLIEQPLVVINVPGAGGSIGSRKVKHARPDGYTVLQIHEGMLTNKYSGNANFGPNSFVPIAGTGRMAHVIAVRDDSPFVDLPSLLLAAAREPDSIVFAVGIGAPSHFAGLMLENASADKRAKFRFTQSGGGAKRFASLLGGHTAVSTFSVAEFVEFRSGGLRALAILSGERHVRVSDVPTAIEQGIDVSGTNMHFWWAPKGTPHHRVEKIADVLQTAMQMPEVETVLFDLATDAVVVRGEQLANELTERERRISAVSQRETSNLPDFGMYALVASSLLGVAAMFQHRVGKKLRPIVASRSTTDVLAQCVVAMVIVAYTLVLQFTSVDYRLATGAFVLLVGGYLTRRQLQVWPVIGVTALLLSVGLHTVFTRVLVVDLP
jgi:tripartite-type tricarboxylate transporter receptor subunit TctC